MWAELELVDANWFSAQPFLRLRASSCYGSQFGGAFVCVLTVDERIRLKKCVRVDSFGEFQLSIPVDSRQVSIQVRLRSTVHANCCALFKGSFSAPGPTGGTALVGFERTYIVGFMVYDNQYDSMDPTDRWNLNSVFSRQADPNGLVPEFNPYWNFQQPDYPQGNPGDVVLYWKQIQDKGDKILLSLGGATLDDLDTAFPSAAYAENWADSFAFFFWGAAAPNPLEWGPDGSGGFESLATNDGTPFAFDGIDIDFETTGTTSRSQALITRLRSHADANNKIITCAPQAPYLTSPNVFNGNGAFPVYSPSFNGALSTFDSHIGEASLFAADYVNNFDAILVQFYNQFGGLTYPGQANFAQVLANQAWLSLQGTTPGRPPAKIYIGLGFDATNYSDPTPPPSAATVAADIDTGVAAAEALINTENGSAIPITEWLGGVMVFQSPQGNQYTLDVLANSTTLPNRFMLYGGQNLLTPFDENTNPAWPI